jgi:hypothetical protein
MRLLAIDEPRSFACVARVIDLPKAAARVLPNAIAVMIHLAIAATTALPRAIIAIAHLRNAAPTVLQSATMRVSTPSTIDAM